MWLSPTHQPLLKWIFSIVFQPKFQQDSVCGKQRWIDWLYAYRWTSNSIKSISPEQRTRQIFQTKVSNYCIIIRISKVRISATALWRNRKFFFVLIRGNQSEYGTIRVRIAIYNISEWLSNWAWFVRGWKWNEKCIWWSWMCHFKQNGTKKIL